MLNSIIQADVTVLEMSHGKVNAMDLEFCLAMTDAIKSFEQSESRCLVMRSRTASRVFSAGIDLKRITTEPVSYTREYLPALIRLFEQVYFCSKPTLAVVEGVAIAGGCVMAAACSVRMGTKSASFGMPDQTLNVPIPQIAPVILRSAATPRAASELHATGRLMTAKSALECGLISELVPEDLLSATIMAQAASMSSVAFTAKRKDSVLLESFQPGDRAMVEAWCQDDLRSRVREYVESL